MVTMAESMGFERSGDGDAAGRSSAAVSWCLHDELAEVLIRRVAALLPWGVAVHSPGTPTPHEDELPHLDGVGPWVRTIGGVPEGMYVLDGLNVRARVYRYDAASADRFAPHHDEVWPGSRVVLGASLDEEPRLEQDRWKYADGSTLEAARSWSWSTGDRVSHLV